MDWANEILAIGTAEKQGGPPERGLPEAAKPDNNFDIPNTS